MSTSNFKIQLKGNSAAGALGLSAAIMLIPANLLPVLETDTAGNDRTDTIYSGTVQLWHHGLGAIAAIVFAASIVIPILKLIGLAYLLFNTRNGPAKNPVRLTKVYAALNVIGRWSMLDVFLAAFLTGLVRFGALATVQARSGIVAFASAVILTILATEAFDPKILWQRQPEPALP